MLNLVKYLRAVFNTYKHNRILKQSRIDYRDALEIRTAGDRWDRYRRARTILDKRCMKEHDILSWEEYKATKKEVHAVVRECMKALPPMIKKRRGRTIIRFFSLHAGSYGWA